jgi:hypothetical protein
MYSSRVCKRFISFKIYCLIELVSECVCIYYCVFAHKIHFVHVLRLKSKSEFHFGKPTATISSN